MADGYEVGVTHTDPNDADTDYDGRSDYEELAEENTLLLDATSFTPKRLAFFRFNTAELAGDRGQTNLVQGNLQWVEAWATKGVQLTNSAAQLKYQTVETNDGTANINLQSGTVRFWFKPLWTSGGGPGHAARLLEVGQPNSNGWWSLFFDSTGGALYFASQTNGANATTNFTTSVSLVSNQWYQMTLTFTNGAIALYTNGVLLNSNANSFACPDLSVRKNGFTLGSDINGGNRAHGVFEDLETFNYPLDASDILENFGITQPPVLISNLRMWLKADTEAQQDLTNRVNPWLDQSGNRCDATQISAGSRPFYVNNGIGGRPAIYFPGTNSISFTLTNTLFTNVTEAEAFVVMQAQTNMPSSPRALWRMSSGGGFYLNTDGNLKESCGSFSPTDTGFPAQRVDQPHIYNTVAVSNEWTIRINGVTHFTRNTNSMSFTSSPQLGHGGSGSSLQGYISEVLIYSRRLNDSERLAVGSYLGQRYSLVSNAPAMPSSLTAFAVSTNQISLTWSNALSNTNISFKLQRRTGSDGFRTIAFLQDTLSYLDSGLVTNTTYSYRVKAMNFAGESDYSTETNLTTLTDGSSIPMDALKVWLKADAGHGGNPVNCWADQTTNNFSAFYNYSTASSAPKQPFWVASIMNGRPAMSFQGTNGFSLSKFTSEWELGEALVVLKSLGTAANQYSALWLMSPGAAAGWHPDPNGHIWENFGRTNTVDTGVPAQPPYQTNAHLYHVAAANNLTTIWINNGVHYSAGGSSVAFADEPRFGWGANSSMFRGYISEAMFFNRNLSAEERNTIVANYLRKRYDLW